MRIHVTAFATVDHFEPKSRNRQRAYDWSNFRLASQPMNTNKSDHDDVIDPFEVIDGWFVLKIGNFEVDVNPDIESDDLRKRVCASIKRLGLNETIYCNTRQEYHDRYLGLPGEDGLPREPLPYFWLEEECPFVAREMRRQGRLRPGDCATDDQLA